MTWVVSRIIRDRRSNNFNKSNIVHDVFVKTLVILAKLK